MQRIVLRGARASEPAHTDPASQPGGGTADAPVGRLSTPHSVVLDIPDDVLRTPAPARVTATAAAQRPRAARLPSRVTAGPPGWVEAYVAPGMQLAGVTAVLAGMTTLGDSGSAARPTLASLASMLAGMSLISLGHVLGSVDGRENLTLLDNHTKVRQIAEVLEVMRNCLPGGARSRDTLDAALRSLGRDQVVQLADRLATLAVDDADMRKGMIERLAQEPFLDAVLREEIASEGAQALEVALSHVSELMFPDTPVQTPTAAGQGTAPKEAADSAEADEATLLEASNALKRWHDAGGDPEAGGMPRLRQAFWTRVVQALPGQTSPNFFDGAPHRPPMEPGEPIVAYADRLFAAAMDHGRAVGAARARFAQNAQA